MRRLLPLLLLALTATGCEDKLFDDDTAAEGDVEPAEMNGITAAHNAWRTPLGIPDLVWSGELAGVATAWSEGLAAENCSFYHSSSGYGENLFAGWPAGSYSVEQVVDAWGDEVQWYDYDTNTCDAPPDGTCGHYTQVVWADSLRVGCGRALCDDDWEIVTCNYDPPGNWVGEWPY